MRVPVVRQLRRGMVATVRPTTVSGAGEAAAQKTSNPAVQIARNSAFNISYLLPGVLGAFLDRWNSAEFRPRQRELAVAEEAPYGERGDEGAGADAVPEVHAIVRV